MSLSIRKRLLVILLGSIGCGWIIAASITYWEISHEVEELFDAQLAQSARVLLSVSGHELREQLMYDQNKQVITDPAAEVITERHEETEDVDITRHLYAHSVAYQIWLKASNSLLVRSITAPDTPLSAQENGFSTRIIKDENWRVFALHTPGSPFLVQVGETHDIRDELTNAVAFRMLLPVLVSLPILALLIWYGVGHAMRPLVQLAIQVGERRAERLEPISDDRVPVEAKPLIDSMNTLFKQVEDAFDRERRFTADAAHELRTPLAAIKTQAQVALRAMDKEQRVNAIDQVIKGVDRTTRLVAQLLTLARLDPAVSPLQTAILDLGDIAGGVIAERIPLALEKNIDLELSATSSGKIPGNEQAIAVLIGNLVENALRYTPAGGKVQVLIGYTDNAPSLQVMDSGPGIPLLERDNVFKRFYRLLDNHAPGSGLGLSIVGRIAELHHATISLDDSPLGGLSVRVSFPIPATDPQSG